MVVSTFSILIMYLMMISTRDVPEPRGALLKFQALDTWRFLIGEVEGGGVKVNIWVVQKPKSLV